MKPIVEPDRLAQLKINGQPDQRSDLSIYPKKPGDNITTTTTTSLYVRLYANFGNAKFTYVGSVTASRLT